MGTVGVDVGVGIGIGAGMYINWPNYAKRLA
jgi:hypothetical protein